MKQPSSEASAAAITPVSALVGGFLFLCFFWGTSWVAIKYSLLGLPPFLGATARFVVAMIFLGGFARWRGIPLLPDSSHIRLVLATGLMVYWCNYGLIYWAELYLSAGISALLFSTFPIFTGLFSNFIFRLDRFRTSLYAGLLIALAGIALVFSDETTRSNQDPWVLLAGLGMLTSAASGALSALIVKKYLQRVSPVSLTFTQMLGGTGGLAAIGLAAGELDRISWKLPSLLAVLYLGIVASAIAFVLYYWLLQRMNAVTLSLFVYVTPLVAILADRILLNQTLSATAWVGTGVVLLGVLLSQWNRVSPLRRPVSP